MLGITLIVFSLFAFISYFWIKPIYDYVSDPKGLRRFYGMTLLAPVTNIPFMWATFRGNRFKVLYEAHKKHKIIRTGPNAVSFNDIAAVRAIYGHGTPVTKDDFYKTLSGTHRHLADVQNRDDHAAKRRVLSGAFAQSSIVHWEHIIAQRTAAMVAQYDRMCIEKKPEKDILPTDWVNHRKWSNLFAIDAITEIAVSAGLRLLENGSDVIDVESMNGRKYQAHYRKSLWLGHRIQAPLAFSTRWYPTLEKLTAGHPWWTDKFAFDDIVIHQTRKRLARYQAGEKLDDFFSFLLEDKYGNAHMLPMGELIAEVSIMFNAGSDTTGIALTNVLYWLIKHPQCLKKLRRELDTVLEENEDIAPYDKVKHLPYLRACLDESLRITPPNTMSIPRVTPPEGLNIMDEWIPGGTTVHCPPYAMHRNEEVFPDAESYKPERWLHENSKDLQQYFLTFSTGARGCIGRNITYLEQTVVIATLVHRYDFALPSRDWILPQWEAFTCSPGDMPVVITRRRI
jgi:cytochrome P450